MMKVQDSLCFIMITQEETEAGQEQDNKLASTVQ